MAKLKIVGLGGSLARSSTSRAALQQALEGAEAGAETRLLDLRELDLPMYTRTTTSRAKPQPRSSNPAMRPTD